MTILELAINRQKAGMAKEFSATRARFVKVLQEEPTVTGDGKWRSFFTVDEGVNPEDVLVGITEWASMEAFGEAADRLLPLEAAAQYFATFDILAYLQIQPEDGGDFDLRLLSGPDQIVEFAVRAIKPGQGDEFVARRTALFDRLATYDGYRFDREFVVVGDETTRAVIIVWESAEAFDKAAETVFALPEYGEFMAINDVQTYQATTVEL